MIELPSKDLLKSLSYKLNINTKRSLSKYTKEELLKEIQKMIIESMEKCFEIKYPLRIKSINSCYMKYDKNIVTGNSIKSTFNDIISIRIIVDNYPLEYPNYFRVVDMRNGKKKDDGYKGVHLYYQLSNHHLPIEIQINTHKDRVFADICHKQFYKRNKINESIKLRKTIDKLNISDYINEDNRKGLIIKDFDIIGSKFIEVTNKESLIELYQKYNTESKQVLFVNNIGSYREYYPLK